ncbi:MAG: hypothetical protein K9N06_05165 [Candidatus Cloacimonetes bacterium]|nr:hypothetical protein [Candidatus Cloacimonadota bacterium]
MSFKKALAVFIILASMSCLSAYGGLFGWKGTYGTMFHVTLGSQTVDLSTLNDDITFNFEASYPEGFLALGAQYFYLSNDLMLGLEGKFLNNGTHKSGEFSFQTSGQAGFLDLGYVLFTNRFTIIAPWIGLGMGSITYSMAKENTWAQAVDQTLPYTFSASKTAVMMNWGLCFDFVYTTWSLGLSAGYMHPIANGEWQLAGEVFEDGPDTYLSGAYLNFNFGYTQLNLWSSMVN